VRHKRQGLADPAASLGKTQQTVEQQGYSVSKQWQQQAPTAGISSCIGLGGHEQGIEQAAVLDSTKRQRELS
jgi:hypothetical protein